MVLSPGRSGKSISSCKKGPRRLETVEKLVRISRLNEGVSRKNMLIMVELKWFYMNMNPCLSVLVGIFMGSSVEP